MLVFLPERVTTIFGVTAYLFDFIESVFIEKGGLEVFWLIKELVPWKIYKTYNLGCGQLTHIPPHICM
jgi:hypothetical protein